MVRPGAVVAVAAGAMVLVAGAVVAWSGSGGSGGSPGVDTPTPAASSTAAPAGASSTGPPTVADDPEVRAAQQLVLDWTAFSGRAAADDSIPVSRFEDYLVGAELGTTQVFRTNMRASGLVRSGTSVPVSLVGEVVGRDPRVQVRVDLCVDEATVSYTYTSGEVLDPPGTYGRTGYRYLVEHRKTGWRISGSEIVAGIC